MEIPVLDEALFARALVSPGLSGPLERFREKLRDREPITYGAIGGSITEGAAASDSVSTSYGAVFAAWLNNQTACTFTNAGRGATTSMFGAFRAHQEMLCHVPDIVTVEFAVNDTINPDTEASYEALVRQCLESAKKPLVILIFTMRRDGMNLQDQHIPIGRHYVLPMLSYRDALHPEVRSGRLAWETLSPDEVHPNDGGHAFIASLLERYIELGEAPEGEQVLPELLNAGASRYLGGRIVDAVCMDVLENDGWTQFDHKHDCRGWMSDRPGARLKVKVKGGKLLIGYVKYAGGFGMVAVKIDGKEVTHLDGFYDKPEIQAWAGGHTVPESLCDDAPGTERVVEITLLEQRHPKSIGHHFELGYFLVGR
ncbi:MAG: SGNH/GDSL hydrolase family protein [Puniceicoccales bacterium]